jgi:CPA2 family monovalent cation:H+ antiporter-2
MILIAASSASVEQNAMLAEIGGLLLVLGVAAFVATRFRFSVVPVYLIFGLALGKGGLFPVDLSEEFLNTGAQIGAILLLLLLGLEYSGPELVAAIRNKRSAGLIDFLVNALPGALIALIIGWGPIGAMVLGGITYVSSSGIAAQMLKETGWQRSELSRRITSVLVIEDLFLAPYLPLLTAIVFGLGAATGFVSVAVAILMTSLALLLSFRGSKTWSSILDTQSPGGLLLTVFGGALMAAGFAAMVGFSSSVAAFLVGLMLTGEVANAVRARLSPLRDLFAAIFFLFFGLNVSVSEIPAVLPLALLLAAVGIAGKMFTGWWIARDMADGLSWYRAGAFLIPRGEFSILIASLAVGSAFGVQIEALTLTYVILTTIASSIALRLFRSKLES